MPRPQEKRVTRTSTLEHKPHNKSNFWDLESHAPTDNQTKVMALVEHKNESPKARSPSLPKTRRPNRDVADQSHPTMSSDPLQYQGYPSAYNQGYPPHYHYGLGLNDDANMWLSPIPSGVDGVWDPSHSNNLVVQLNMDIREDLSQELAEFCRLYKIGLFTEARSFFEENLGPDLDKPYVFVMYAEMLLRQGSYHEICELDDYAMRGLSIGTTIQPYSRLLKGYWELIQLMAQFYTKRQASSSKQKIDTFKEDLRVHLALNGDETIGSLEIGMVCRLLEARSRIAGEESESFLFETPGTDDAFVSRIYNQILREGRVWDMRDLLEAIWRWGDTRDGVHDGGRDFVTRVTGHFHSEGLGQLIKDWNDYGEQDLSTTLALLDLLTSKALTCLHQQNLDEVDRILDHATPLASSLSKRDETQTKSRGYTQWIIAKASSIAFRNPELLNHQRLLKTSTGITIMSKHSLPVYIPINSDNPGRHLSPAQPQVVDAMHLAINNARDLGDHMIESSALMCLVMISPDPALEIDELCELQHLVQGDMVNHLNTLFFSYLVSKSEQSKLKLRTKLEDQKSRRNFKETFSPDMVWQANMILHALQEEGPTAEQSMKAADDCVLSLSSKILVAIKDKIPNFYQQVHRRAVARQVIYPSSGRKTTIRSVDVYKMAEAVRRDAKGLVQENSNEEAGLSDHSVSSAIEGSPKESVYASDWSLQSLTVAQGPETLKRGDRKYKTSVNSSKFDDEGQTEMDLLTDATKNRSSDPRRSSETEPGHLLKVSKNESPTRSISTRTSRHAANVQFESRSSDEDSEGSVHIRSMLSKQVLNKGKQSLHPVFPETTSGHKDNQETQKEIVASSVSEERVDEPSPPEGIEENIYKERLREDPSISPITRRSTAPTVEEDYDGEDDDI